jgi:hypothetical protein
MTVQNETTRKNAVLEAYWSATEDSSHGPYKEDLQWLYEYLIRFCEIEKPTLEQQKALLFMLPLELIGSGISWGFRDSAVRDNLRDFVEENAASVKETIANQVQQAKPAPVLNSDTSGEVSPNTIVAIATGTAAGQDVSDHVALAASRQPNAAAEAIEFSLRTDSSERFLQAWFNGDFDVIRREWPECPESVFVGADPLRQTLSTGWGGMSQP